MSISYPHYVWLYQPVDLYEAQVQASSAPMILQLPPPSFSPPYYPGGSQLSLQVILLPLPCHFLHESHQQ